MNLELFNHLATLVQQHEEECKAPENNDGYFDLSWYPNGWALCIIMPGHYGYEQDEAQDVDVLLKNAIDYYSSDACIWTFFGGGWYKCSSKHPLDKPA